MAKLIIEIVDIIFTRVFLRAIVLFVVLVFISNFFPWTKQLYDDIFPEPELRIEELTAHPSTTTNARVGDEQWFQRIINVANRGNGTADGVFISAAVPWGRITRYEVYSDYPYTVHSATNTTDGYLLLKLEQLAPGAKVILYLWGVRSTLLGDADISFSAIYNGGSAPRTTKLSSSEEIKEVVDSIVSSFQQTIQFVKNNEKVTNLISTRGIQMANFVIPSVPSYLAIVVLTIVVLSWLFLDAIQAAFIYGMVASSIYWLRVSNFSVPPIAILVITVVPIIFFGIAIARSRIAQSRRDVTGFAFSLLLLLTSIFLLVVDIYPVVHQIASYVTVGYIVVIFALVIDSR